MAEDDGIEIPGVLFTDRKPKEKRKPVGKKNVKETRAQRRRKVELKLLSGLGVTEIASALGYSEDTIQRDIEYLQTQWAKRPEAKDFYEKRIATLTALSDYWLRQSQDESNPPNTRLAWAQGWMKLSDELASLTGVQKYAEGLLRQEKTLLEKLQGVWYDDGCRERHVALLENLLREHGVSEETLQGLKERAKKWPETEEVVE